MTEPRVLISILNWNSPESTIKTIQSVNLSEYRKFNILVIDNNSVDDSIAALQRIFPDLQIIQLKRNLGYAGAHWISAKRGIKEGYDLLWMLNNDVEVYPFTLGAFIQAHYRNKDAILGSVSLKADGHTIHVGGGSELIENVIDNSVPYNQYAGRDFFEEELTERPVSDVEGASMVIPIFLIKKFGFLDTSYFLYGEEVDYCYRMRIAHKISSIIVPSARVIHHESQSFSLSPQLAFIKSYYMTRNSHLLHYKYCRKNFLQGSGNLVYFIRFFLRHYIIIKANQKLPTYWIEYYSKLGAFHAFLGLKGKYFEPNRFLRI